jgi:hypothetical protein
MKLNRTNKSPLSDSPFNTLLFFVHLTFCIEKLALGSHYDEDWQTNKKYSAIWNGTRHFLSFQSTSIWSTSGVSAVTHCQTSKTTGSFHALSRCQIILHVKFIQLVQPGICHIFAPRPPLYFSASTCYYRSPARRRCNTV